MLGDFRLVREAGRGGMGVVYEAEQISLGRRVALKVLPVAAARDARQLQRFRIEAQAAALLHHTHIVPVHAVGCERGVHDYAMQFIEGRSLAAVIDELRRLGGVESPGRPVTSEVDFALASRIASRPGGDPAAETVSFAPTPPRPGPEAEPRPSGSSFITSAGAWTRTAAFFRAVARLGIQAAEALEHAHRQGVLHRDIKPANPMIDEQGDLWVTDFGLARPQEDSGLTMTGDLLGTARYMSPEQAQAGRAVVDLKTDVYSLGVTLYELQTPRPAFDGRDRRSLLHRIAVEEPRRPGRLNPSVPADMETVVLKAMAKEPAARYASA